MAFVLRIILCAAVVAGCAAGRVGRLSEPTPAGAAGLAAQPDDLLTVAESSGWKATASHAQVVDLLDRMAAASDLAVRLSMGESVEGRELPLLVIADPPVGSAKAARAASERDGRLIVFAFGNIHAGEVDGKEALPILARELITTPDHPLLKSLIVVIAPIYNADGNERVGRENRPGQAGPEEGMGIRENAQGLDLNRDYVKAEAPETRAMLRFIREWDPHILIDTHTTNGSLHQYIVTYAGPKHPAGDAALIDYVYGVMMPAVTASLREKGLKTFWYGNFNADRTRWESFPPEPRYSTNYFGLRNRIGILSEGYSYAGYEERVIGTRDFVRACLEYAAAQKGEIRKLLRDADERAAAAGREPGEEDLVPVRTRAAAFDEKVTIEGFVEEERDGRPVPTGEPRDHDVELWDRFEPALSVPRPYAYLFPASLQAVVENLQRHGIEVHELREDIELDVESYRVASLSRSMMAFQGHELATIEAAAERAARRIPAGTIIVRTGQRLGPLACLLLEPQSEDGLAAWNFFDEHLAVGEEFPVLRLPAPAPIITGRVRPLAEERTFGKRVTYEVLDGPDRPNFSGAPIGGIEWLEDGDHFLQSKDGKRWRVHAETGRAEPFHEPGPMAAALAEIPAIGPDLAKRWAESPSRLTGDRTAALFDHENDLYYARLDGSLACRLTSTPQREELAAFSPDGGFVAFVRDNDLHVVDVATRTERALTTGGSDTLRNGKADWVYYEEVFGRDWRTFWWSPDSRSIAFLRTDSSMVPRYTLVDDLLEDGAESSPYPKPGQPNPQVRLGIVGIAGGSVRWADTGPLYDPAATLITGVGWWPDSSRAYFYAQNRTQTWLDVCTVGRGGGKVTKLLRDQTEAWVEPPGGLEFLRDGSFLMASERTGWRHLYRVSADGKRMDPLTSGGWEARTLRRVDEEGGWVYVEGTRDSHIARNLYRARLDARGGAEPERLTAEPGSHRTNVSPNGKWFVDSWSGASSPTRIALRSADGSLARMLDTNPVYDTEEYDLPPVEYLTIPARDGFELEAVLVRPDGFDPALAYPVWISTYAGPHAPSVSDDWAGARARDRALANTGVLVFLVDPRPASGKGAASAWTAYRRLGVQELADLEDAVAWLTAHPWADGRRVGISGFSYGGFMTAFALTHSTAFSCGIAGGSPTDWRDYDTIYTERYMLTPQENPEGYDETSCVKAAADLHGRLLLVHGLMDDNVHAQNTWRLARALQDAGKEFEMMMYPGYRHGVWGRHYERLVRDFIARNLGAPRPHEPDEPQTGADDPGSEAIAPREPAGHGAHHP